MNSKVFMFFCLLASSPLYANTPEDTCDQSSNVQFERNDIFDLSDPDTIFLHHWANFLHIKTKQVTLKNESAFFMQKCAITDADMAELERHLRKQRYIREAEVTTTESETIKIETWDNWSLLPTIEAGRKGGINKYAIGIQDRNLLGLGIDADIEYFSDDQRTGYKFDAQFPLFLNKNINASIRLTSNDDGNSEAFYLYRDFVSFDTVNAFKVGIDNFNQIYSQFQNGITVAEYRHEKSYAIAQWQWLYSDSPDATLRFGAGIVSEENLFSLPAPDVATISNSRFLPEDRDFQYPFVSIDYVQKDFREFTNFNLISQIEDFNLGWQITGLLGSDFSNNAESPDAIWNIGASKGVQTSDSGYLFFTGHFEGEYRSNAEVDDRLQFSFSTEYFHKFNDKWGAYFKNTNVLSKNYFLDDPVAIGDDSGVRGYPLKYQHGERTTQFTAEARYYPHINIYKVFELGGAAFIDAGRAFGDSPVDNVNTSTLASIGLGARFYSTHSSEGQVIHFDFVKPLSSDPNVNNIEFRITSKQSF